MDIRLHHTANKQKRSQKSLSLYAPGSSKAIQEKAAITSPLRDARFTFSHTHTHQYSAQNCHLCHYVKHTHSHTDRGRGTPQVTLFPFIENHVIRFQMFLCFEFFYDTCLTCRQPACRWCSYSAHYLIGALLMGWVPYGHFRDPC